MNINNKTSNLKSINNNMNEFIITEKFDLQNAYKLLNSSLLDDENKGKLIKYLKYSDGGKVKVKYIQSDIGRLSIKVFNKKKLEDADPDSCTVQSYMWKVVKGALCAKYYKDVDIDNAHPMFLLYEFNKNKFNIEYLKKYVNNRDSYFESFAKAGVTRFNAKILLMKILYGGSLKSWCNEYNFDIEKIPDDFIKLQSEINVNTSKILKLVDYEKYFNHAVNEKGQTYYNLNGTALSFLAQTIECKMLLLMKLFFEESGFTVGALIHDGLHVEKKGLNKTILKKCSDYLFEKSDIRVGLSFKDFQVDESLKDCYICENQYEASIYISDKLKNDLIICDELLFMKKNRIWTMNPKTVKRYLQDIIPTYNILTPILNGYAPCNKTTKNINDLIQLSRGKDDPLFMNKLFDSNLLKLCFDDGYYDFKLAKFIKGFDNVMTTKKISRGFPIKIQEDIDTVFKEVLNPIFNDNIELRDYFIYYIARGLAGHIEDKTWAVGQGERNCGKGCLGDLLKNAFEGYVKTTNSENFIMKQGAKGDEAKNLSWLMDFCFTRLMITNEITIDSKGSYILNGNMIKKISSGGDSIEARKNFQDEVIFKVQCRPILFCNDLPGIEPKDALSTLTKFEFPCQFVKDADLKKDNELNPLAVFKETDDQIKNKCKTDKFINAFIHIIIDSYHTNLIVPECVKSSTAELNSDDGNDTDIILKLFNYNASGKEKCKDIHNLIKSKYKLAISSQKIFKILKSKGIVKQNSGSDRLTHYVGMTIHTQDDKDWIIKNP